MNAVDKEGQSVMDHAILSSDRSLILTVQLSSANKKQGH